jgi:hypothetical protein
MKPEQVNPISYNEANLNGRPNSKTVFSEVLGYLPKDLLTEVTILLQDSDYVTVKPIRLARSDWYRLDRSVKRMGGIWVSNTRFSHWRIPLVYLH